MPSSTDSSRSIRSIQRVDDDIVGDLDAPRITVSGASDSQRRTNLLFIAILLAYAGYIAFFIYRSSFVVGGERYFSLFDDAMISMRYAKNLALGNGMVWNAGERVEGITNPLWTMIMGVVHLLPIAPSKMSLPVQIISALFLLANLFFVRKIAEVLSGGSRLVMLTAVVFTAFYLPLNTWSLLGMEVGLLALLTTAAAWKAIEAERDQRFSPWPYLLLGLGTLVRVDMAVPFVMLLGFNVLNDRPHWRRHLQVALPVLAGLLLAQTAARWWYYGEILPNTYYLKMTGYPMFWRMMRGLLVAGKFAWLMNWVVFCLPFVAVFLWRNRPALLLLTLVVGQMLYSIYVGGDAWETWGGANRYICVAMPSFFILLAYAFEKLHERVRLWLAPRGGWKRTLHLGLAMTLLLSFANVNAIYSFYALPQLLLITRPLTWGENRNGVRWAQIVERFTKPGATVAVAGAGVAPYFFDRPAIDELGKCDKVIARQPMHSTATGWENFTDFYPGHMKWDSRYSIGTLRPDAFIHLLHPAAVADLIERDYTQITVGRLSIWLRNDSRNVRWDQVTMHVR